MSEFKGTILKSKFLPDNFNAFSMRFDKFKDGEIVVVGVEPYKLTRREAQNALYWVRMEPLAIESGYHGERELHAYFKYTFIARPFMRLIGREDLKDLDIGSFLLILETSEVLKSVCRQFSSTKLNTKEFSEFMESVAKWSLDNYKVDMEEVG